MESIVRTDWRELARGRIGKQCGLKWLEEFSGLSWVGFGSLQRETVSELCMETVFSMCWAALERLLKWNHKSGKVTCIYFHSFCQWASPCLSSFEETVVVPLPPIPRADCSETSNIMPSFDWIGINSQITVISFSPTWLVCRYGGPQTDSYLIRCVSFSDRNSFTSGLSWKRNVWHNSVCVCVSAVNNGFTKWHKLHLNLSLNRR